MPSKSNKKQNKESNSIAPSQVKFKYIFDKNYNPVFVNGAFGGIKPSKELAVNIYLERHPVPYEEVQELKPDFSLGKVLEKEPKDECPVFVRFVSNGVILTLEGAILIHEWLGDQIKNLEILKSPDSIKKE